MSSTQSTHSRVFAAQRQALIHELRQSLRSRGVDDDNASSVLAAMSTVPREEFVPDALVRRSYENVSLPIGNRQTISQPLTVALMTALLLVRRGDKILEIGTGSGYQAAVLTQMGAQVFTIERVPELYRSVGQTFERLGIAVSMRLADGTLGWHEEEPFQGIIVTAGAPDLPPTLTHQLGLGGRLIIPVGGEDAQTLYCITRTGTDAFDVHQKSQCSFVPLIGEEGWGGEDWRRKGLA
jgi:protein-L-isoaspartate(D-aspartate) O-methyltransferase